MRSGPVLLALTGPGVHLSAGNGAQARVLVAASGPSVTGLQVHPGIGETILRFLTNGELRAPSGARLENRFQVLMPGVDLSAVAGSWGVGTPEILEVRVSPNEAEGITVEAAPGVVCDPSLFEAGLEIACRAPPQPASAEDAGGADGDGSEGAAEAAEPRVSLDFRDADLRDVLRVLSEVSGLDFVLQPGVSGRVSLRLTEIPWDRALKLVLRSQRLGHVLEEGVLRVGPSAELGAEYAEARRQEEARELAGELITFTRALAYVRPDEVKEVLEARLSERGTLIADQRTGTVLVADVESRIREIESVLDVLDIPVPGVEIEARIVLATRTLTRRLGIQWGGGLVREHTGKKLPQSFRIGADAIGGTTSSFSSGSPAGGVSSAANADGGRPGYGVNLPISGAPTGALGLALGALGGAAHLDLALSAAERKGEVRILSAPRIVAQNSRPATIKQGVTFPVQVVANNTVTVQFRDAVLELTVTPQVSPDGTVLLDLLVSNDSLDFGQAVGGIPSILTQRATTRIRVKDGATTVLGGVFATQEAENQGRVPGLHRIPLLGHLFRSREQNHRDEELLIFLTPRIRSARPTAIGHRDPTASALNRSVPGRVEPGSPAARTHPRCVTVPALRAEPRCRSCPHLRPQSRPSPTFSRPWISLPERSSTRWICASEAPVCASRGDRLPRLQPRFRLRSPRPRGPLPTMERRTRRRPDSKQ